MSRHWTSRNQMRRDAGRTARAPHLHIPAEELARRLDALDAQRADRLRGTCEGCHTDPAMKDGLCPGCHREIEPPQHPLPPYHVGPPEAPAPLTRELKLDEERDRRCAGCQTWTPPAELTHFHCSRCVALRRESGTWCELHGPKWLDEPCRGDRPEPPAGPAASAPDPSDPTEIEAIAVLMDELAADLRRVARETAKESRVASGPLPSMEAAVAKASLEARQLQEALRLDFNAALSEDRLRIQFPPTRKDGDR